MMRFINHKTDIKYLLEVYLCTKFHIKFAIQDFIFCLKTFFRNLFFN